VMPRENGTLKSGTVQLKVQLVPRADIAQLPGEYRLHGDAQERWSGLQRHAGA
jgi:hypothetical protein